MKLALPWHSQVNLQGTKNARLEVYLAKPGKPDLYSSAIQACLASQGLVIEKLEDI